MHSFTRATSTWFERAFAEPTPVQQKGWPQIQAGRHALLLAPTGSGKTLAAFLHGIDSVLAESPESRERKGVRVLYVSPLKALAHDVERNLRAPLVGIEQTAKRLGVESVAPIRVDVRTGDTSSSERQRQKRDPGEILVTTPESLFLILGSQARETLRTVHTVIVDEVHAVAPTKRGVHLALTLERLGEITDREPQRIGLSATVRPAETVARFLGGNREVVVVDTVAPPKLHLEISTPISDLPRPVPAPPTDADPEGFERLDDFEEDGAGGPAFDEPVFGAGDQKKHGLLGDAFRGDDETKPPESGIWAALYPRIVQLVQENTATIVFVNSRSVCERLANKINEIAGEDLVRAHHGSVSHEQRREIEEALKRGALKGIVATSSLELGIDMGAVDLVVLVESPGSVARGLQRIGRAGHEVGGTSHGIVFPKQRGDLLECAVLAQRMLAGEIEPITVPTNALDVLAQQIVAIVVDAPRTVDELERIVRRSDPYRELSRPALVSVLDMLSGRYPSDEFADLRPRLSWDRALDRLSPRRGTPMISRLNAGTIPDRGLFTVHHVADGGRVGELDEEMVHESRVGDVILLGASSWRIAEISRDRVLVEPAPGQPGRLPFWRGDGPGRPVEVGRAIGALVRTLGSLDEADVVAYLREHTPLDEGAATALAAYVREQREHTGGALPTDRSITIERFRDEIGDWRIVILTPFGSRIHAPWALALQQVLSRRCGFEVVTMYHDDGIALTLADGEEVPDSALLLLDPEEVEDLVTEQVAGSSMFGASFRENAARALLLPRRSPTSRSPLWAQRLKAKSLLAAVQQYPDFPIVLETYRQCLRDVFDLDGLREILGSLQSRSIRVDEVETRSASPFAGALVFMYVATFMYKYDAPLAERRAQVLTLDRGLLRDLLGQTELRELIDAEILEQVESELQRLHEDRRARDPDELHDLLRTLGAMTEAQLAARSVRDDPAEWLDQLRRQRRACVVRLGGEAHWIAAQDAGIYVHALGVMPPAGLPEEFLRGDEASLEFLVRRFARTHGPFAIETMAEALFSSAAELEPVLARLESLGTLTRGELRPGGTGIEWCDDEVLRRLKRRTLAKLRGQAAAVPSAAYARFLADWQGIGAAAETVRGVDRLRDVLAQLEGLALPWSTWITTVLPARVPDFEPEQLDMLCAMGEIVWIGRGALGPKDGRVAFYRRDTAALLVGSEPQAEDGPELGAVHEAVLTSLRERGASFLRGLREAAVAAAAPATLQGDEFEHVVQDLMWSGRITNDTTAPLRAVGHSKRGKRRRPMLRGRTPRADRVSNAGGRWSLVEDVLADGDSATQGEVQPTERLHALVTSLLERFGLLSRDVVQAADVPGGFTSLYRVLDAMEEAGRIRRGHFVEGLRGAQFALPAAVDRLRAGAERSEAQSEGAARDVRLISAVDPANPWGSILAWPEVSPISADAVASSAPRPRRIAGAWLVTCDGLPVLWVASNRRSILTLAAADDGTVLRESLHALRDVPGGRSFVLETVDGVPVAESRHREQLERAGFVRDYQGWTLREASRGA